MTVVYRVRDKKRYTPVEAGKQKAIVKEYKEGVRGREYRSISKKHNLSTSTVVSIIRQTVWNTFNQARPPPTKAEHERGKRAR